jgi:hypothetical protein
MPRCVRWRYLASRVFRRFCSAVLRAESAARSFSTSAPCGAQFSDCLGGARLWWLDAAAGAGIAMGRALVLGVKRRFRARS